MMPEDMVRAYDTLALADAHAVIACYLRNREEVSAYLKRRQQDARSLRTKIETDYPRISPDDLLARGGAAEKDSYRLTARRHDTSTRIS